MHQPAHRETIFLENAEILTHEAHAGDQFLLRVRAPECARHALPGSFAHVQCDPTQPMRRPISIMRADPREGWVEFLYKVVGAGTQLLAARLPGNRLSLLGPIGQPFRPHEERPRPLLIGGGIGMPPLIFLTEFLQPNRVFRPFVMLGSEVPFPFPARPSRHRVPDLPPEVIAGMPLLDEWGIPNRLASLQGYPGCYKGYVTDLAHHWLVALDETLRNKVEIFACGPYRMLEAVARLAQEFGLPCQISVEEFMACGVGGCAGCVVRASTPDGPVMKRVCVDGPVFDAAEIFPEG